MAGGLAMAFSFWFFAGAVLDKIIKSGDVTSYSLWLPMVYLFPIVGVLCHYGGEFIDYSKKSERSLESIGKRVDDIKDEMDDIKGKMDDIKGKMDDINEEMDDKIADISDCLKEIKYNTDD